VVACEECAYDGEQIVPASVASRLLSLVPCYREAVSGSAPSELTARPEPEVWSPLEYLSHVRDVFLVQRERVVLAQVDDLPNLARMHRDERVALCGYSSFAVDAVLVHLATAAELCAATFAALGGESWSRRFVYNWPSPAEHDLAWLARHTLHEGTHHLFDLRRLLTGDS
jgi:hypothetical protein